MKRQYSYNVKCNQEGCNEWGHYVYNTKKEYNEGYVRNKGFKCVRHSKPDSVLSVENKIIISEQIAKKSSYPNLTENFWDGKNGFTYGNGYRAFAKDFPEGTILKVTAEIILPKK